MQDSIPFPIITLLLLQADDLIISREGISSMSVGELQVACKERGMRASGLTQEKLSTQLNEWIELSTNEKVRTIILFEFLF